MGTLWTSLVSTHLMSKALTAFCSTVSFQGYLYSEHPWKMELVSPSRTKGRHAGRHKLKVPLLWCSPVCAQASIWAHPHYPVESGGTGNWCKCVMLVPLSVPWVVKSFVSEPIDLDLLPASVKLWQATLVACKEAEFSGPSQFLTVLSTRMGCWQWHAPPAHIGWVESSTHFRQQLCRQTPILRMQEILWLLWAQTERILRTSVDSLGRWGAGHIMPIKEEWQQLGHPRLCGANIRSIWR